MGKKNIPEEKQCSELEEQDGNFKWKENRCAHFIITDKVNDRTGGGKVSVL